MPLVRYKLASRSISARPRRPTAPDSLIHRVHHKYSAANRCVPRTLTFNSLHAQREACESYILSQRHEGWQLIPTEYDDGGFSGGTMERPALKKLMTDIAAKRIDTVVVYKVDRLTRSLMDFVRIVEQFDKQGI